LFPFKIITQFILRKSKDFSNSVPEHDGSLRKYINENEEDNFSKSEREYVYNIEETSKYPLIINNLRKLYHK
jgi:hypothetical protein